MFNLKKRRLNLPAHIVSAENNKVIFEVKSNGLKYKKGHIAMVTVSTKEKAVGGKKVIVSDVVAQGPISDVSGKQVTICSNKNNTTISEKALMEAKNNNKKLNFKILY